MHDLSTLFEQALRCHLAGDLQTAQQSYEDYLRTIQSAPVVRTNLAGIYLNQARFEEAAQLLELALIEAPDYAEALSNRGYLSVLQGRTDEAIPYLERALAGNPALAPALTNLIPIYLAKGLTNEALQRLNSALELQPESSQLHELNAQLIHHQSGAKAASAYLESMSQGLQGAALAAIESVRGRMLLADATDLPAALAVLESAITAHPVPSLTDLINKGETLRKLCRHTEALDWVNACLASHAESGGLLNLKGCILQDLGHFDAAAELYRLAIAAEPINPLYYANLGFLCSDRGSHKRAITVFSQGLERAPDHVALHHGMAQAHFHLGKPRTAYRHFTRSVSGCADNLNVWDNFLYFLSFVNLLPAQRIREHCETYAQQALAPRLGREASYQHAWSAADNRPLRIGVISAEIGSHCVSYFLLSLIRGATSDQAEFYLFPSKLRSSEPRWPIFQQHVRVFTCIEQLSDHDAAALIRSYNLDVVLETTQHMVSNRLTLMNHRLAPVQAHYIGMHGTTGVPAIDYFIGDSIITPEEFAGQFTERLLRLPRTWVCYTLPEQGLPELRQSSATDVLRLGSFNNVSKISRECLRIWAEVLLALPHSSLMLKDSLRNGDLDHQHNLISYFTRRGVNPDRIKIVPRTHTWEEHMDLYNDLDIALDTLPLTSGTTAFDALLMGVPLVAYSTPWIGGRLSASIVNGFGQPDWIAESKDDMIRILLTLSADLQSLRSGRAIRREKFLTSELCDQQSLATAVIDCLRSAYIQAQTTCSNP